MDQQHAGPSEGLKIWGWQYYLMGIISPPPGWDWVNWFAKIWGHPLHPQGRHPWPRQSNKLLLGVSWQYVRQGQKNCTFSWVEGRSLSSILNSEGDVYYEIHREKKSSMHSARQYPVEIQTREHFFLKVWKMNFLVFYLEIQARRRWNSNYFSNFIKRESRVD